MPTIGQKLEETRHARDLTIEDAAHATRIHPSMIALIEDDDYSRFPSVAYAKSFIRKYSDYLGVDLEASMGTLDSGESGRLGDNELMGEMKRTIKKDRLFRLERRPRFRRRSDKPGRAPVFLNLVLAALIGALAIFYFLGYNAPTPEAAREEIAKGLRKANPFGEDLAIPANPLRAPSTDSGRPGEGAAAESAANLPLAIPGSEATAGAAAAQGVSPPVKSEVTLELDDAPRDPSAPAATDPAGGAPLRPRNTPGLDLAEEALTPPALGSEDLPAVPKPRPEPQAQLRPEGTDPAATTRRNAESPASGGESRQGDAPSNTPSPSTPEPAPAPPVRAVPVAASE